MKLELLLMVNPVALAMAPFVMLPPPMVTAPAVMFWPPKLRTPPVTLNAAVVDPSAVELPRTSVPPPTVVPPVYVFAPFSVWDPVAPETRANAVAAVAPSLITPPKELFPLGLSERVATVDTDEFVTMPVLPLSAPLVMTSPARSNVPAPVKERLLVMLPSAAAFPSLMVPEEITVPPE